MSLTREQLDEAQRMIEAAQRGLSTHGESDVAAWLAEHGPELLRELRNLYMLRGMYQESVAAFQLEDKERREAQAKAAALTERVAGLEKERSLHLDLLEDAWYQWSHVIEGHDDSQLCAPRHDMCLSTLEDIRLALFDAGRLVKYAARPEMDWWVRANLIGLGAGASRTEASE